MVLLKEGRELAVHLDLDRQASTLAVEANVTAKPNSPLAAKIAALAAGQSVFAGLSSSGSAMHGLIHAALPEEMRKEMEPLIDQLIRSGLEKEQDKAQRCGPRSF